MSVVVLGATAGVGGAITQRLARSGYYVIGFHRGNHDAKDTEQTAFVVGDVGRSEADVAAGIETLAAREQSWNVDLLIHCLSGASIGGLLDAKPHQIERTFNTLAHSFLWWVQGMVKRKMFAANAQVIGFTSPITSQIIEQCAMIAAAKAALRTYTMYLAHELNGNPRVNLVEFGTVMTPALAKVLGASPVTTTFDTRHRRMIPAGRMQTANDVADFVVQLANNYWFNGAVIDYTGGVAQRCLSMVYNGEKV